MMRLRPSLFVQQQRRLSAILFLVFLGANIGGVVSMKQLPTNGTADDYIKWFNEISCSGMHQRHETSIATTLSQNHADLDKVFTSPEAKQKFNDLKDLASLEPIFKLAHELAPASTFLKYAAEKSKAAEEKELEEKKRKP